MKQTLDVLYLKTTGHVLEIAARAGDGAGPALAVLAGAGLSYPARDGQNIVDTPVPDDTELATVSVPFTDSAADALFQREVHHVKDGALVSGLAALTASFNGQDVTVTIASVSEPTPYVVLGVPAASGKPVVFPGEIPASTAAYTIPQALGSDIDKVVVFVKGFKPEVK